MGQGERVISDRGEIPGIQLTTSSHTVHTHGTQLVGKEFLLMS